MTTAKIHRPNLLVADLDRSLRIYRDILGFQVAYAGPASEGGLMQNLFNLEPDTPLRIAFLSAGDDGWGALALTESRDASTNPVDGNYRVLIITEIDGDLDEVIQQLKDEGLTVDRRFELYDPPRTDVAFTDPDGHRVVLFRQHPVD